MEPYGGVVAELIRQRLAKPGRAAAAGRNHDGSGLGADTSDGVQQVCARRICKPVMLAVPADQDCGAWAGQVGETIGELRLTLFQALGRDAVRRADDAEHVWTRQLIMARGDDQVEQGVIGARILDIDKPGAG
jgi:hypothetical protein